jgi:hypothetical protein
MAAMTNINTNTPTTTGPTTAATAPCPVSWFEIHTADPARARRFAEVFGWTFDDTMPDYPMIGLGEGAPIGGGLVDSSGRYPDHALFMVQVPDVDATLAAVVHHGGSVVAETQVSPAGLAFAYVANPDGSVFGVWCPPPAVDAG